MISSHATADSPRGRTRDPLLFRIRRGAGRGQMVGMVIVLAYVGLQLAVRWAPRPEAARPQRESMFLVDRDGVPLAAFVSPEDGGGMEGGGEWHVPLEYDEISPHLLRALVAVEDRRFMEHGGVDFSAAASAAWSNATSLRIVRGASTLTMQVARLRAQDAITGREGSGGGRSFVAKGAQAFAAMQLELRMSKREILTEYVNRAPFGGNLVGAGAAAWRYFGKSCRELSLGQAALLAGLPQSPNRFRPDRFPARASIRRDYVLDRMHAAGFISQQQAEEARREPIDARWHPTPQAADPQNRNPALPTLSHIATHLVSVSPGHRVIPRTTFSSRVMQDATTLTRAHLATLRSSGVTAAGVVIVDTQTAECLAALSFAEDAPHVDLTRSPRSSGSTLKPFIYAAAMDAGLLRADTVLDDSPASWAGYTPANFDRAFRGTISAGEALAESRNIPAMTVLARLGVDRAVATLDGLGFRALAGARRTYGLPLAVGGADVTALELAGGYATLARGGVPKPIRFTLPRADFAAPASLTPQNSDLGIHNSSLLSPSACAETLACLTDPTRTRGVAPEAAALKPAWKTGTSSGRRDAWCAAVTPRLTVVVWLGNANAKGSQALVGIDAAAPLALRIIAAMDAGGPTWEPAGAPSGATPLMARRAEREPLAIVTPSPNQRIVLHDDQAADHQRISLSCSGGEGGERFWFVDNQAVTGTGPRTWWTPARGVHTVKVVDPEGRAASVRVTVE